VLWESLAINLYLAKKHAAGRFNPATLQGERAPGNGASGSATELEKPMIAGMFNALVLPPEKRDAAVAEGRVQLDRRLPIADLNLAAVSHRALKLDLSATPSVKTWLERSAARAALKLRG
jgi:glutathione S-transferase